MAETETVYARLASRKGDDGKWSASLSCTNFPWGSTIAEWGQLAHVHGFITRGEAKQAALDTLWSERTHTQLVDQATRIATLEAALREMREYTTHDADCPAADALSPDMQMLPCECGLDDLVRRTSAILLASPQE